MQKKFLLSIALIAAFSLSACNRSSTPEEQKEETQVENMLENDEQRADSLKRALGLE
jgi:hypothetical protein